jgi:purine-cytosine permease-like protein
LHFYSVIPIAIVGAHSFAPTLSDFLGIIGYWAAAFIAIILEEHYIFRYANWDNYDISAWNDQAKLTTGIPGLLALGSGFGVAVPCMDQVWYIGPIAHTTGDIGFEMAFVVAILVYPPLRWLELKYRKL